MKIGIDFDNTIAYYDEAFLQQARVEKVIPVDFVGSKSDIKDYLLQCDNGHEQWMKLQGYVYGKGIHHAVLAQGIKDFFILCKKHKVSVFIVSHKTEFGHFDVDRINLRDAAREWMQGKGFFQEELGLDESNVFFESTRDDKISRIKSLACTHFIDDLIEVLTHPEFPKTTKRYLIGSNMENTEFYQSCPTWNEITASIF